MAPLGSWLNLMQEHAYVRDLHDNNMVMYKYGFILTLDVILDIS